MPGTREHGPNGNLYTHAVDAGRGNRSADIAVATWRERVSQEGERVSQEGMVTKPLISGGHLHIGDTTKSVTTFSGFFVENSPFFPL